MLPEEQAKVPNFVGPSLPRRDKGSREEYCMTMLTLFKPYRTPKNLKLPSESWEMVMENHKFTTCEMELMDFFQLRYECLDARDDYRAQLQKGELQEEANLPFDVREVAKLSDDMQGFFDDADEETMQLMADAGFKESIDDDLDEINSHGRKVNADMQTATTILQTSGALEPGINNQTGIPDFADQIQTGGTIPASQWKQALANKRLALLEEQNHQMMERAQEKKKAKIHIPDDMVDETKVVDKSYLCKSFKAKQAEDQARINNIAEEFTLNEEQERAYRIIANHATEDSGEQLKMYLGGMAGTGKSQVIKAISHFFNERGEGYRFMCLAPTGTAAALIGGSTYHSILKFNKSNEDDDGNFDTNDNKDKGLMDVQTRLKHVNYVFLDKVSMVDCEALFRIGSRLSKGLQPGVEFGGINIICASDFAQLPPVASRYPLYTGKVFSTLHYTNAFHTQNAAIGKALWHQFTTVVILR